MVDVGEGSLIYSREVAAPRSLPNLTVQQLEYLVAVGDGATWADAAERVGVSPSALSQGLAELERRVGITLFAREGRRRVLTPDAAPVLAHARAVVAATRDLSSWAARVRDGDEGTLRVGMIDAAAVDHYPEVLHRFRRERPDVELRLAVAPSGSLLRDLSASDLDLAVCVAPPRPVDGVEWTRLRTDPLAVYAPPDVEVPGPPGTWGPWVTFPEGSHTRRLVSERLEALGARFDVVAESHQPEVLREMVELGMGWTVLPTVQAESGSSGLRRARDEPVAERQLVVARRIDAAPLPAADHLVAALRAAS